MDVYQAVQELMSDIASGDYPTARDVTEQAAMALLARSAFLAERVKPSVEAARQDLERDARNAYIESGATRDNWPIFWSFFERRATRRLFCGEVSKLDAQIRFALLGSIARYESGQDDQAVAT